MPKAMPRHADTCFLATVEDWEALLASSVRVTSLFSPRLASYQQPSRSLRLARCRYGSDTMGFRMCHGLSHRRTPVTLPAFECIREC